LEQLIKVVSERTKDLGKETFLRKDAETWTGWCRPTTIKCLEDGEKAGYLECERQGVGKAHVYTLVKELDEAPILLMSPEELAAQLDKSAEPVTCKLPVKNPILQVKSLNLQDKVAPVKGVKGETGQLFLPTHEGGRNGC
jgi:hypothetical protein